MQRAYCVFIAVFVDSCNNVEFAAALYDHADIDFFARKRGEHFFGYAHALIHIPAHDGYDGKPIDKFDLVGAYRLFDLRQYGGAYRVVIDDFGIRKLTASMLDGICSNETP